MPHTVRFSLLALSVVGLLGASLRADVAFIGQINIPGTGVDLSGLPATLLEDNHNPQNALNGFGSGLAYTGNNNTYFLLADRGPNKIAYAGGTAVDNTTTYDNRYQVATIQFAPVLASLSNGVYTSYTGSFTNTSTVLLKNASSNQYVGIASAFATANTENRRLDPESVRVASDGSTWISDEYGPYILHFNAAGQQIGSLTLPPGFALPTAPGNAATEAAATTGRVTNKGAEGLSLSPDGKTLVVAMQNALVQDNGGSSAATNSVNNRFLVYDLTNPAAAPKQFLYQLDSKSMGISDLVAINDHQILVDERDGVAGAAGVKKLFLVDISQPTATNLANTLESGTGSSNGLPLSTAPGLNLPADVVPLQKGLFADIGSILNANAASAFINAAGLPDKIEGYAIGPDLPDGRHLLLATNDNDFGLPGDSGYRPNYIFAFAFTDADVAAAAARAVPEPASLALLGVGILGLALRRRHTA